MKFGNFVIYLFLFYETLFYLVIGQTVIEEKNDCTKLYDFLKVYSPNFDDQFILKYFKLDSHVLNVNVKKENIYELFGKRCCSEFGLILDCDEEDNIIYFENLSTELEIYDITSFPYYSKLETLYIQHTNSSKTIPENILKLTNLKNLILRNTEIEVIPTTIQNLSKLEVLNLDFNNIKELPSEIYNLRTLKKLNIRDNKIGMISSAIENLSNLEELKLSNNFIKELPNEIFNLPNLKELYLEDNLKLSMKLKKFSNSTIKYCDINNIDLSCYEPHTCAEIKFNDKRFYDFEAEKELKICNKNLNQNDKKKNFPFIIIGDVILGIIIGIIVIIIIKRVKGHGESNFRVISDDNNIGNNNTEFNNNNNETNIHITSNENIEENDPPPAYTEFDTNI